jgi:hypothetical protein
MKEKCKGKKKKKKRVGGIKFMVSNLQMSLMIKDVVDQVFNTSRQDRLDGDPLISMS